MICVTLIHLKSFPSKKIWNRIQDTKNKLTLNPTPIPLAKWTAKGKALTGEMPKLELIANGTPKASMNKPST